MEEVDEEKCYQNNSSYTDAFSVLQQWRKGGNSKRMYNN